jgi:hypothetical protein
MAREQLTVENENGELVVIPSRLVVCDKCQGEGTMDHPVFNSGITSSEWHEMDGDEQDRYMSGGYDVACDCCGSRGMVRVADIERTTFAQRRLLVLKRRDDRDTRQDERERASERRFMGYS